jgi:hypothetical protein
LKTLLSLPSTASPCLSYSKTTIYLQVRRHLNTYLEHVSSTARIIGDHSDKNDVEKEYKTVEQDLTKLGSADKIQPSIPSSVGILSSLRDEEWVLPVVIIASTTILLIVTFEVYILLKSLRIKHSRRHLFLGQILMAGLLCCAVMSIVYTMKPTPLICAVIRFGSGLSYTLLYSTLLVKMIFLISVDSGIHLHSTYQILLLSFAVLIQLVIGIQWLVAVP